MSVQKIKSLRERSLAYWGAKEEKSIADEGAKDKILQVRGISLLGCQREEDL